MIVLSVDDIVLPDKLNVPAAKLVREPTDVMLGCAAVVNVPEMFVPDKLPPVILPVALINPLVKMLPPVTLPLADTTDPNTLEPVTVPVAETSPLASKLPPVILPIIEIDPPAPAVTTFAPAT